MGIIAIKPYPIVDTLQLCTFSQQVRMYKQHSLNLSQPDPQGGTTDLWLT